MLQQQQSQTERNEYVQAEMIWAQMASQYARQSQILEQQLITSQIAAKAVPKKYFKMLKQMKMGKSKRECAVCFVEFSKGEIIIQVPCKHIFHKDCLKPWLKLNKHCPSCRFDVVAYFEST